MVPLALLYRRGRSRCLRPVGAETAEGQGSMETRTHVSKEGKSAVVVLNLLRSRAMLIAA